MLDLDDDFDDAVVQAANNVDEDFLLASQLNEVERRVLPRNSREEEDLALALKLSKELNNDSPINNRNLSSASPYVRLHSSSNSNSDILVHDNEDSDFLLAIRLSQSDYLSPPRKQTNISFDDYNSDVEEIMVNSVDSDFQLAVQLSRSVSPPKSRKPEENDTNVNKYLNKDITVVDPSWETIDPNPDIYSLFIAFNKRFFWGKLDMVEVKWSPRMTLCAGICTYQRRAGHCTVKLSKPLLQLRPRRDLVETLLHEMIHAYLFVTHNDRDRDGHGPQFHSHMYRINRDSGSNITVYHSFHDEVRYYKTHEWRCDGPCREKAPFYGYVRRSMNRAPGPYDSWWSDHRARCGGNFIKTKEPEDYQKKKSVAKTGKSPHIEEKGTKNGIDKFFKTPSSKMNIRPTMSLSTPSTTPVAVKNSATNVRVNTASTNKKIFTLSDLANNKRSPTKSLSGSPKKWKPLPGQQNILHFTTM